ncbi:hypothetical protein PGB90_003025 [Kerria lacca]
MELNEASTITDVKKGVYHLKKLLYPDRQSIRLEPRGKTLKDSDTLKSLGLKNGSKLYVKDLGPQIGWSTVFLCEYAGPLFSYLLFYLRPSLIYGAGADTKPMAHVVHLAALCWSIHYAKRLLETIFVHRFSHATMPIMNLFKNCSYYWGFAAYLCELGNLSIHLALRDLRPPGTKIRRIPKVTSNPFTILFDYVSCPNYFYEFGSWVGFTIMTSTLPAGLFTLAGMYQMSIWALGKHRNYKKEFPDYPKQRKAIVPFLL